MSQDYNTKGIIVRGFLNNVALKFQNEEAGYVTDRIFPIIGGLNKEAKVYKYSRADAFRSEAGVRAPGGEAPIAETRATAVNVDPVNYSIGKVIPDELRQQAAAPGNFRLPADTNAVNYCMDQIMMKREKEFSKILHATSWSGVAAGGADAGGNWGNTTAASDTMVNDLAAAESTIVAETGVRPNTLLLDFPAWQKIKTSPFWLDKLNNTQFAGNMTPEAIAQTLNYNIIIGWSVENTDPESTDQNAMTSKFILSLDGANNTKGNAFLFYRPTAPALDQISVGYQYRIRKPESGLDIAMYRERLGTRKSDLIWCEQEFDIAPMVTEAGYHWKNTAEA